MRIFQDYFSYILERRKIERIFLLLFMYMSAMPISAQEFSGITGLLNTPTAETDSAGTFRGGMLFLNKHMTPANMLFEGEKYNTGIYFIGLTAWPWIELSAAFSLKKMHKNYDVEKSVGYYNQDRRMNLKLRPLKEGRWWPAVALGIEDLEHTFEKWVHHGGETHFHNYYGVASKHLELKGNELAAHLGYRYYVSDRNANRRGVFGGLAFRPRFYRNLRVMAEWDGDCVNVGADVLLWRHLFIQAGLTNGKFFMGGVAYHYTIKF